MTVTVELAPTAAGLVLPLNEWVTILSGPADSTLTGSGVLGLVTVTLAPTPGVACQIRAKSRVLGTFSTLQGVSLQVTTLRLGPFDVATGVDIIEVQARRIFGEGGLSIIDAGGLQGSFSGADGGTPAAETGITGHPQSQTITAGQTAVFTVSAVGANLTYLGERSTDGGTIWTTIGTSNQITVVTTDQTENGYQYRFTVSGDNDPGNNPVVSNVATLTVNAPVGAVVTAEPDDQAVVEGEDAVFSATASNANTYTVYVRTGGTGSGTSIGSGAGGDVSLFVTNAQLSQDGNEYRWGFVGDDATEIFTRWALLTVTAPVAGGALASDEEGTYS